MTAAPPGQGGIRPLLARGPFRRLLTAQGVSALGDWVGTYALMAAAFDLTGSPTAVGGVLVLRLVPPVVAAPIGGVLADRLDRRMLMITTNVGMAGFIVLVPFVNLLGLYLIVVSSEILATFFLPARDATVPELVPPGALPQANGLVLGSSYASIPVGAALFSGLRLAGAHVPGWVPFGATLRDHPLSIPFLFDTATFLFAAAMIAGLPRGTRRPKQALNLLRGLAEAARYVRDAPGIRSLAAGVGVAMLGGGTLFALGIGYVRETLGGGDVEFGFLTSLWGVGMAAGIGVVRLLVERGEAYVFQAAVAACGGILIAMAFLPFLWLAFLSAVAFGIAFSTSVMLAMTLVQRMVDQRVRGSLVGAAHMLFRVSLAVGALGVGGAAGAVDRLSIGVGSVRLHLDGNQFGLILGGGIILLGALAAGGVVRAARSATSPGDPPAPGQG